MTRGDPFIHSRWVALEIHPNAAKSLMADAVDLAERMPHTWAAVQALRLPDWVARKIAHLTTDLDFDSARGVDAQIAGVLASLPVGRLLGLVEARVVAADPAAADAKADQARRQRLVHLGRETEHGSRNLFARCEAPDAARVYETCDQIAHLLAEHNGNPDDQDPETLDQLRARALGMLADPVGAAAFLAGRDPRRGKAVVYVHTTPDQLTALTGPAGPEGGVARVEDYGPYTRTMLRNLLGHDHITLKPVIDLADGAAADCYEIPAAIAERLHLAMPADVFPYAASTSRWTDNDHTDAYDPHGPPGQTRPDNLGHLIRYHHLDQHAPGWKVEQLPGHRYLWTTPHGRCVLVDRNGTHKINQIGHRPESDLELRLDVLYTDYMLTA